MMDYHPFRGGTNPEHSPGSESQTLSYFKQGTLQDPTRKGEFEDRLVVWIRGILNGVKAPVVIVIAPGHSKDSTGQGNLIGVGMGGGAAAPPTFQQEGLSPPNVHMLSLLFNVEPPQLLNHSYAYESV